MLGCKKLYLKLQLVIKQTHVHKLDRVVASLIYTR